MSRSDHLRVLIPPLEGTTHGAFVERGGGREGWGPVRAATYSDTIICINEIRD